jgi:hypothetical protein
VSFVALLNSKASKMPFVDCPTALISVSSLEMESNPSTDILNLKLKFVKMGMNVRVHARLGIDGSRTNQADCKP